jgi:hypothetical protein
MRVRRLLTSALLIATVSVGAAPAALATTAAPTGGPDLGEHVSDIAPEHPLMHGRHFGECVARMAGGAECPHAG